jgi:hypothetical protein
MADLLRRVSGRLYIVEHTTRDSVEFPFLRLEDRRTFGRTVVSFLNRIDISPQSS